MLLRLENCDSETVSNETDPGDSLLSSLASLTALVSTMDGANRYNWNCVIFKPILQLWGGRWEAVTEVHNFMKGISMGEDVYKAGFTKED